MADIKAKMLRYAVEAKSVKDFLERYTRPACHATRGPEYVSARIAWHSDQVARYGYTIISRHESATGDIVAYFPKEA